MKMLKKALSVFLAVLMLMSALTTSFYAAAAEIRSAEDYRALAYSFFNYTIKSSGHTSENVITTDAKGFPVRSIVGDMDHYTISNASGEYKYADDEGEPIRAISYDHKVTAKDNSQGLIKGAAQAYLAIVDNLMSTEYGVGLYTIPMIADEVSEALKFTKGDNGEYLFLDGYTYLVDAVGNIKARSPEKTYEVVDGEIVELETDDSWLDGYNMSSYTLRNLYDYCHVSTVIDYFSGNCTSINSGNWFHEYTFCVETDMDTVLTTEMLTSDELALQSMTVSWALNRQYDDSGTKAQYYNAGYTVSTKAPVVVGTRAELVKLQNQLDVYFKTYLTTGSNGLKLIDTLRNSDLVGYHYGVITKYYDTFTSISNAAKVAVFGQAAYSYMNLVTQLKPIVDNTDPDNPAYWPKHTYTKHQDANGNNVVYQVDAAKVTSIVNTIDGLLKSERVGSIVKMFFNYTDPQYENMAYYTDAQNAKSAQDMLKILIADLVYQDSIINMLLELVYPMVCSLLDDLITDAFIEETLGGLVDGIDLAGLIDGVVKQGAGWQSLIYAALSSIGVTLTPAGLAYVWNRYGYLDAQYGYTTMFPEFKNMHDHLKAAKGGITESGLHNTGDYYAIGSEHDGYCGDRWRDVDFSKMVWNINGSQEKFLKALDAVLAPLAPLLGVLFGDTDCSIAVAKVLETKLTLILNDDDITHNYYNTILLPLFETLGIPTFKSGESYSTTGVYKLLPGEVFESRAEAIRADSSRNPNTISAFLNEGLLGPILHWVNNILLADPIGTILNLLPNLSYFLTNGAVFAALGTVKVPIKISHAIVFGAKISVYTLDVMELIGEDTIGFLDSLQGILNLIGFDVDTGVPIVGYHAKDDARVYNPNLHAGYNPDVHTEPVSEAYINAAGNMYLYNSDFETRVKISGLDENGEYTIYAVRNNVGWANTLDEVSTESSSEYNIPVTQYYSYTITETVTNAETGEEETIETTYRVLLEDMIPSEIYDAGEYTLHQSIRNIEVPAALPSIMDYKLQAVGTETTVYSGRYGAFNMTNREGTGVTWTDHTRKYIDVQVGGMETEGLVLLFLFRFIFSAVMYRGYDGSNFDSDYTLLDAFGLDKEMLSDDLFAGLKLQDIIDNIVLDPDGAIAALYELFYKNEFGSLYKVVEGVVVNGDPYSYAPEMVDYHADEIFFSADDYEDYTYGTSVLYSEHWTKDKAIYMAENLDDIAENVFKMLKLEGMGSLGEFLEGFIDDLLFTNDMLSNLASMLYGLIGGLGGSIDIPGILDAALDVDLSKDFLMQSLEYEFGDAIKTSGTMVNELGETVTVPSVYNMLEADQLLVDQYEAAARAAHANHDYDSYYEYLELAAEAKNFTDNTFYKIGIDEETQEERTVFAYDWGYNNPAILAEYSKPEIFLRGLSAIAAPFSFLFKFLFAGEDLSILNLITIPGYEAFQYSWIPLMDTLGATNGLVDFKTYYSKIFNGESEVSQNCDTIYYTVKPLIGFVEKVIANPIEVVLNLLPNLLFFISIGGLNDVLNNLIHFAYVLLDILAPVFDAYPLLNSLLGNLNIGGMQLNLSVPLDFDFNQLVNQLIEGLVGDLLSFDIENKNIVLGTEEVEKEVFIPTLDEEGNEQLDEEGNVIGTFEMQTVTEEVYAVGTLSIALPYIDLSSLCAGTVVRATSVSGSDYVYLNGAGGADLITLIFRIVTDTLFFMDNAVNIANFLIGFCQLDDENGSDEILMEIFTYLNREANEAEAPDVILNLIYTIYQLLVPLSGALGSRFENVDFSITDLFEGMDDLNLTKDRISALLSDPENPNTTLSGFARLIDLIKQFFEKIALIFSSLFGG